MRALIKTWLITASLVALLAGCGGGGGGGGGGGDPPVTDPPVTDPPVTDPPVTDPPVTEPTSGGIPNTLIPTAGIGDKDLYFMPGGGYEDSEGNSDISEVGLRVYAAGATMFGRRTQGSPADAALSVPNPPRDVRTAWRQGWTGDGVNILIVDSFAVTHGHAVSLSAAEVAPGAALHALEVGFGGGFTFRQGGVRDAANAVVATDVRIDVLNMSFGTSPLSPNLSAAEWEEQYRRFDNDQRYPHLLRSDASLGDYLTNTADAVLVKAAGNNQNDAGLVPENRWMATHSEYGQRVLIVGGLDQYAQRGGAKLADSYSNYAGDHPVVQQRFLVEYGTAPYRGAAYLCDAASPPDGCDRQETIVAPGYITLGTSHAAPRVAGHAALVRHKFPGLTAPQTTKILLDTATYEGLMCNTPSPGCDIAIYGQGRVHIADALSPIGKLE